MSQAEAMEQQSRLAMFVFETIVLSSVLGRGKKKPMEKWQLLCSHSHHFRVRLGIRKEEILYCADGEAQAAQRSIGGPIPGSALDQAGWGSEQPSLGKDVPAHSRGIGTRRSLRSFPIHSMKHCLTPASVS